MLKLALTLIFLLLFSSPSALASVSNPNLSPPLPFLKCFSPLAALLCRPASAT